MAEGREHWEESGLKERMLVEAAGVPTAPMQWEEAVLWYDVSDYYSQAHSAQPGQLLKLPRVHWHFGHQVPAAALEAIVTRVEEEVAGPMLTVVVGEELLD